MFARAQCRQFQSPDRGKHIFWRELNLAVKHKIEYDKCFFYQNIIYFFANNQDKKKRKKYINLAGIKFGERRISSNLAGI